MLHEFLTSNTDELILRCKEKAASRYSSSVPASEINHGVLFFLKHVIEALTHPEIVSKSKKVLAPSASTSSISRSAASHGAELMRRGFTIEQVVHEYGDACQAIAELAIEQGVSISTDDFRVFNRCLDDSIAEAVTAYANLHQGQLDFDKQVLYQQLDTIALEQQRLIEIAIHSHEAISTGNIGMTGATGTLLKTTLEKLRRLSARNTSLHKTLTDKNKT